MKFPQYKSHSLFIALIIIIHIVGVAGLSFDETRDLVNRLTPITLGLSVIFLFAFHKKWSRKVLLAFLTVAFLGYLFEVVGVATGLVFGLYSYGSTLGISAFGVPLVLGLLWLLMVYTTRDISKRFSSNIWVASLIGAGLMCGFDFFLEPVAIELGYWSWALGEIPLQNYFAWFLLSFVLQVFLNFMVATERNPLSIATFLTQLMFFVILRLLIL